MGDTAHLHSPTKLNPRPTLALTLSFAFVGNEWKCLLVLSFNRVPVSILGSVGQQKILGLFLCFFEALRLEYNHEWSVLLFLSFFFFFFFLRAALMAYGGFQARSGIGAVAAGLHHSHHNARSKLHLQPTPQLMATLDL